MGAEANGHARPGFRVGIFAEERVVVICRRSPAGGDEEPGPEHFLADERPDLDPDPCRERIGRAVVDFGEEEVVFDGVEVQEWSEAQEALANDKVPSERAAAVAHDVAVDLRNPEGEVGQCETVGVDGARSGRPGSRVER